MAFVNEFVPKEDIERLGLVAEYFAKHPWEKTLPETFNPHWTVDKERNIYLRPFGSFDQAHEEDPWIGYELGVGDYSRFRFYLYYGKETSLSFTPYLIVWDFIRLETLRNEAHLSEQDAIELLKEALAVYGYWGAVFPNDSAEVKFSF